jgi:hypothetical protein
VVQQADVTQITMQLHYQRCQRLITAKMVPGRDGQPVHVQVHVDLATLRGLPGGPGLEADWGRGLDADWGRGLTPGWSPARAAADPGSVFLSGAAAEAAACDATLTPVVSGHIDWTALDELTRLFVTARGRGLDHHRDATRLPATATGRGPRPSRPPSAPPPANGSATRCCR